MPTLTFYQYSKPINTETDEISTARCRPLKKKNVRVFLPKVGTGGTKSRPRSCNDVAQVRARQCRAAQDQKYTGASTARGVADSM